MYGFRNIFSFSLLFYAFHFTLLALWHTPGILMAMFKRIAPLLVAVVLLSGIPQAVFAAYPTLFAGGVLAFTNVERYREGLPLLVSNTQLSQVAYVKMQDLFARQYFAHEAPVTGDDVSDLAQQYGYIYLAVGENLALGDFTSNRHVVESWMGSPGHRENILSPKYTEIGIAAGRSMHKGRYVWIVVQAFGTPRSLCPTIDEKARAELDAIESRLEVLELVADMRRDALEVKGLSRSEYNARVELYNKAAELYNSYVAKHKKIVAEFNEGVDAFNECVDTRLMHTANAA